MSKQFLTPINLNGLELLNALAQNVASEPASAPKGLLIYNTSTNKFGVGNGTSFDYMGAGNGGGLTTDDVIQIVRNSIDSNGRGITIFWNTGTKKYEFEVAADRETFVPSLRTLGTGAQQAAAGNDFRLSNSRSPSAGSVINDSVAASAAITLDKLAETTGLKILTAAERTKLGGISSGATANSSDMALRDRSTHTGTQTASTISDFNTQVNALISAVVDGAPGALDTLKELAAALGNDPNFATTVTNNIALKANKTDLATVATSGSYADLTNKPGYAATIGDGTALTFTVTHSFNTRRVQVSVVETSGTYSDVEVDVSRPSLNAVSVAFAKAPAAGAYEVLVTKVG